MLILHIDTSPRPGSATRLLSAQFIGELCKRQPGAAVTHLDLVADPPPTIDADWAAGDRTPSERQDEKMKKALAASERYIGQLYTHDHYVFALPMHNFTVPANFKLWIDHVTRLGRTFVYTAEGPKGLLRGKRAAVITARGGYYVHADPGSDFQVGYMKKLLGFIGVHDVAFVHAEGLDLTPEKRSDILTFANATLSQLAEGWATQPAA